MTPACLLLLQAEQAARTGQGSAGADALTGLQTSGSRAQGGRSQQTEVRLPQYEAGTEFQQPDPQKRQTELLASSGGSADSAELSAADSTASAQQLPSDFDWQTYVLYHPELREVENVQTEEQAKQHYLTKGRAEGRIYKRLRVLLRYTACTGLINQQYSHIAAFALGAVLGAELVLPPAVKRDSFAHYFSTFKDQNEVSWTADPLDSLLDVDKIMEFWHARGLVIHKVRCHGWSTPTVGCADLSLCTHADLL